MKTLKKILSLIIVFTMIMSVVAFAGYRDVDVDADYAGAVELLSALDIFVGDDLGNFNPDKTITRAEMAAIMCRAKGLEGAANSSKGSTKFYDVPASHWASGYINIANQNGIIAGYGDGNFGPDDTVTYNQAVKMVVSALGFDPMASSKGGWPTGYLVVANTYGITEGVSNATRADIAVLVYNALSTPMMDQTSWGSDIEFEILDGNRGKDYRTLLTDMDIYIATGVVGSKTYDEVEFDITEDSEDGEEFKKGDYECFEINNTDIANYQHQNVEAYVSKVRKGDYKVIAVVPSVEGSTMTIISDDVESFYNNKVEYYINSANSSKTKTIKVRSDVDVEYNKGTYKGSVYELLLEEEDVELKFIENTGDNTYDAIVATKYLSARVEDIDANKDKITIDGKVIDLDFDDEDVTIILEDLDGNRLDLADFAEDDVVAVVADNTNIKNYIDYIRIIKLDNAVVRGTVEGTYSSNGEPYVIIDGDEYIDDSSASLAVGDEGLFFIGMTGKIIDFDGNSAAKDYAYILECAISTQNFSDDLWQIKLLTSEDGIITYTLNADASEYFENTYASYLDIDASVDTKQLFTTLSESEKANPYRLITYKTNSRGYIKSFKPAYVYGTTVTPLSASKDEYNYYTQMIGGAALEDNAIVFNLSNYSADNAYATDIDYLTDEGKYSGFAFANDDYEYCVMVITAGESSFDPETGIAIVTKVVKTSDADDNDIIKVSFIQDETSGVVCFDDDSENRAGSDTAYESLGVGDIFVYNANSSGAVSEYAILGTVKNGLLNVNTAASGQFDEDTELIYGYIANSERKKTSKGETITINNGYNKIVSVASSSNKYTYNDAGRNVVIEIGDFTAEDAYYFDEDINEATFAFVKLNDGFVTDIYSFNKRVIIGGAETVELLVNIIGTVEYTDECLAKIVAAEEAYASLSTTQKAKVSNYSVLVEARAIYDGLKAEAEAAAKEEADRAAAAAVVTLIDAIGVVDGCDDCKNKIEAAEAAYKALTQDQKTFVVNYTVLTDARAEYDRLVEEAESLQEVTNVIALINAIGTVDSSAGCKAKIDAAREAYDALDGAEKGQVDNYETLTEAEAAYDALVSTAAVGEVILLIDSIGEVEPTDECKEKIDTAESAYAALSSMERTQVTNSDELSSAKIEYTASVAKVANVKNLINAIGTVVYTSDCADKIEAASAAYKALATTEKYAVTNYSKLAEAEIAYDALKVAAKAAEKETKDKAEAAKVDALIADIGTVDASDASKAKIEAAEKAYEALTAEQKAYVINAGAIATAKTAYAKAVEEAKIAEDKAEAAKVDAIIAQIGTVDATDASKAKIEAAEKAYEALTAEQKAYVINAGAIATAKTAYAKAVEEAKIAEDKAEALKVDAIIAQIGEVDASAASKAKIDAAEKAYEALTADQKKYVANYATLTATKTAYAKAVEEVKIAADKAEAAKVDALIAQIGSVTATDACKAKIEAAEKAYASLTADQKKYVANYATLTAARTVYNALTAAK